MFFNDGIGKTYKIKMTFNWISQLFIDISVTERIEKVKNCLNEKTN